jgi:hypothetical protein
MEREADVGVGEGVGRFGIRRNGGAGATALRCSVAVESCCVCSVVLVVRSWVRMGVALS